MRPSVRRRDLHTPPGKPGRNGPAEHPEAPPVPATPPDQPRSVSILQDAEVRSCSESGRSETFGRPLHPKGWTPNGLPRRILAVLLPERLPSPTAACFAINNHLGFQLVLITTVQESSALILNHTGQHGVIVAAGPEGGAITVHDSEGQVRATLPDGDE